METVLFSASIGVQAVAVVRQPMGTGVLVSPFVKIPKGSDRIAGECQNVQPGVQLLSCLCCSFLVASRGSPQDMQCLLQSGRVYARTGLRAAAAAALRALAESGRSTVLFEDPCADELPGMDQLRT